MCPNVCMWEAVNLVPLLLANMSLTQILSLILDLMNTARPDGPQVPGLLLSLPPWG